MYNKPMKKLARWGFITAILLLDFAALDDITTGNEPDYSGEYAILILSVFIFVFLIYKKVRTRNSRKSDDLST